MGDETLSLPCSYQDNSHHRDSSIYLITQTGGGVAQRIKKKDFPIRIRQPAKESSEGSRLDRFCTPFDNGTKIVVVQGSRTDSGRLGGGDPGVVNSGGRERDLPNKPYLTRDLKRCTGTESSVPNLLCLLFTGRSVGLNSPPFGNRR